MADPILDLVAVTTHGRVLTEAPSDGGPHAVLMGFHGYAENAALILDALRRLDPDHRWLRVAVQGLHRFYIRSGSAVAASWMTREDREQSIADNIAYGLAVHASITRRFEARPPLVVAGFSQGVAQAYRTAVALGPSCHGVIALGGDLPPDVEPRASSLPPVLVGRGKADKYYSAVMLKKDAATLRGAGVDVDTCVFDGGHEWADGFVGAARAFLARVHQPAG